MPNFEDSFRTRGYSHFDLPLGLERARQLATCENQVVRHAFHPFIRREVETLRYDQSLRKVKPKLRCVDYASHADAAIYSWYGAMLGERYETLLRADEELHSIPVAYRKLERQCNIHFAHGAFTWIQEHLPCVVLCFDIEAFFDTLDHGLLKREWSALLQKKELPLDHFQVFKSLTRYSFVSEAKVHKLFGTPRRWDRDQKRRPPERLCSPEEFRTLVRDAKHVEPNPSWGRGIPQGSPMSGVLSNIYMLPFDRTLQVLAAACGGFARRYSDDVLIIVPPDRAEDAKRVVLEAADERRLRVHTEPPKFDKKLFLSNCASKPLTQPVQYLGFTFDGKSVRIRPQTWSRQCRKARSYLRYATPCALKNTEHPTIYRKTFGRRFTERGKRNFGSYARRSAEVTTSSQVAQQWKAHQKHVHRWLREAEARNQASRQEQQSQDASK